MFDKKKTLFKTPVKKKQTGNAFIRNEMGDSLKRRTATTSLGNGALKYTSTGDDFVDQFGKMSNYREKRTWAQIAEDHRLLYSQDPATATKFALFMRTITRKVQLWNGQKTEGTQRGSGLKHEPIMRMMWTAIYHPDVFWKNVQLLIALGSWKDVFQMLQADLVYNGWEGRKLDWNKFGQLILAGLENPNTTDLVKKFMPTITAKSKCNTPEKQANHMIGAWIANLLFPGNKVTGYKKYRKLKASGNAHQWQQMISKKLMSQLDFNTIHGRALAQLVSNKFLKNQGLESRYTAWIESQPAAKFTGYVYELMVKVQRDRRNQPLTAYQKSTINKQFKKLVDTAKGNENFDTDMIAVVDTSASMTGQIKGVGVSAYDVAMSLALFFSEFLSGPFANHFIEFTDSAVMKEWKGLTPVDKYQNNRCSYVGGTNIQAVATIFVNQKRKGTPVSDFPKGIVCISDGCFNSVGSQRTNVQAFKRKLLAAGFSKQWVDDFKIVFWDIPNNYYGKSQTAFETSAYAKNVFYMSGFDGAILSFMFGKGNANGPSTPAELFAEAMSQEVLDLVRV